MTTTRRAHRGTAFALGLPLAGLRPVAAHLAHARQRPLQARARRPAPRMQTPPPSPPPSGRAPDYHANVGTVIDTLRADYPRLLAHEADMSIFADNVIFSDRTGNRIVGKEPYRTFFWVIRAQAQLFFCNSSVEIQSLYHHHDEGVIYLRWRVQATPRFLWLMGNASYRSQRVICIVDGMSIYKLNVKGLVAEHVLDNSNQDRSRLRPMFEDILAVGQVHVTGTPVGVGAGAGTPQWFRTFHQPAEYVVHPGPDAVRRGEGSPSSSRAERITPAHSGTEPEREWSDASDLSMFNAPLTQVSK